MNVGAFWERIRGYFGTMFGQSQGASAPPAHQKAFEQLLEELDDLRQQALQSTTERAEEERQSEAKKAVENLTASHQAAMREDIMAAHRRLQTGIDEEKLKELAAELQEHCHEFRSLQPDHLPQLVALSIASRFHQEALRSAWDLLCHLMAEHGMAWPDSSDSEEGEKLLHSRATRLQVNREQFLKSPLGRFRDLMFGVVPVWRSVYPERQGLVWQETVLFAVGGALAARAHHHIVETAQARHVELEELLSAQLTPGVEEIQRRLASGVANVYEARSLSDEAVRLCQESAPDLIWKHIIKPLEGPVWRPERTG